MGKSMKNKKIKLIISITILVISLICLGTYLLNNRVEKHQPISKNKVVDKDKIKLEELQKLYKDNNDLYGWIKIEGTNIDYPVMYIEGEDYYLRRDFYKKYYKPGSIFIDKNNKIEPRDINLIIHGHNMKDGLMFYNLTKYKEEEFYKKHKKITLYTLNGKEEYEVIAVFLSKIYTVSDTTFKYYKYYHIETEEEYNDYINNIKERNLYQIKTTAQYPEQLITLSTCEYSQKNGRMVVVAKKKL